MAEEKKKVVCIEDEPEMIDLVKLILGRKGFDLTGAMGMPDMDGWEVYQQMKADSELADIPVIVVTAKAQSIDKVLGLHIAKVDDYVTKPFGPQELLQSVERVLSKKDKSA